MACKPCPLPIEEYPLLFKREKRVKGPVIAATRTKEEKNREEKRRKEEEKRRKRPCSGFVKREIVQSRSSSIFSR